MKIAILTQPLHDNYGGLLQAYTLKETLKGMGHDVEIINRKNISPWWRKFLSKIKSFLLRRPAVKQQNISAEQKAIISKHTQAFQQQYIPELGPLIANRKDMDKVLASAFDAYVVGSDQCWRPRYSPYIQNYFLDFAKKQTEIKRLSYAASFGTSDWEFTEEQTSECKNLLQKFDHVSVREKDGIRLLKQHLGRDDALHVLDPTMLLTVEDYLQLIEKDDDAEDNRKKNLNVYVLDKSDEKIKFIDHIQSLLSVSSTEVMPACRIGEKIITNQNVADFQYPCPKEWIRGFYEAEFVITDSFHGTVFSILFNKPFIALGNIKRGMSRFTSLLEMFGLEDRLLTELDYKRSEQLVAQKIDWQKVNTKLKVEREKAMDFLEQGLK